MSRDAILNSIDGRRLGWTHDGSLSFEGQAIDQFSASILDITDPSYTLQVRDMGTVVNFDSAVAVTLTLPGDMPRGFNIMLVQWGLGNVQFVLGSGATLKSRFAGSALGGQYAGGSLMVMRNADDVSAEWWFGGDGA